MRSAPRPLSLIAALALALLAASPARALSNRVFMSTNGNNAGDCANPLTPCLTFAGAIAQVNAGGEIIAEATGGYGPLTITQSVTISGAPGVVTYSGHQVMVNAPGATVVLRGLTIDGNGAVENGIHVVAVGTLFVESCVIVGFGFGGTGLQGNGIFFRSAGNLFVKDTIIRANGWVAISIGSTPGTTRASIDHCRLERNGFGVYSSNLGGVATVRDSVASGNANSGFDAEMGGELNIENCVAANNGNSIYSSGATIRVSNTTITDNTTGVATGMGGTLLSRGNNTVEGNTTNGTFTGSYPAK